MKPIASLFWTHEHWLHEIQVTRGCVHHNICSFLDAYCTRENAMLYLEACDLGNLKELKENMDANKEELGEIHTLSLLVQLTAALCYLHAGFCSLVQAADSLARCIPVGKQFCIRTSDQNSLSSRRRCTANFHLSSWAILASLSSCRKQRR
jgi:hypothetical protein